MREGVKPSLSAGTIRSACEDSLRRLGTEVIDLYQVHFDDPHTAVEETVAALQALVQAGKICHYGVGHLPLERVNEYMDKGNLFSVLMELNAAAPQAREGLLPLCLEHGVGAIAFSVTGRGLLSGKYPAGHLFDPNDIRRIDALFQRERLESCLRLAGKLGEVGACYGKTAVQMAIAWVLQQPGVICALTGPSTLPHLQENLGGSGWRITEQDLAELEAFFAHEDKWLAGEQMNTVRRILSQSLPADCSQAFTELVYVIETAVLLDWISEEKAMSIFQALYPLHNRLDAAVGAELEGLQRELRGLLKVCQ
jgi:aryl-alcohol dehydrogenase-like predicted oxidoreductase